MPSTKSQRNRNALALFFTLFFIVLIVAFGLSQALLDPPSFQHYADNMLELFLKPWEWRWQPYSGHFMLVASGIFLFAGLFYAVTPHNYRAGEEHGSAEWGTIREINKIFRQKKKKNIILSQKIRVSLDMFHHQRNLNILIIGGPGSSKTRSYVFPNLLECNCNYMITDPKAEILAAVGNILKVNGYTIKVLNLIDYKNSDCFNPFPYLRNEVDILIMITNLIKNTTPANARTNDPFWEKAEYLLIGAISMFLWEAVPVREQNFGNVVKLLGNAAASEDGEEFSVLNRIFLDYKLFHPESVACSLFHEFKEHAKGKTLQSILISAGVRLVPFMLPQIRSLTDHDTMELEKLPTQKTAIFCQTRDDDTTLSFLAGMFYTSYYQTLYYLSYRDYNSGRLPIHQQSILDEFANIALPDSFLNILGTLRSRNMSATIILQNLIQLKKIYEKDWESLVGLCDAILYLGGNEKETHEYISKLLDNETIGKKTESISRGGRGGSSTNRDSMTRELLKPGEVRLLDRRAEITLLGNAKPVVDYKYDLKKHPQYRKSGLYKRRYEYHHSVAPESVQNPIPVKPITNTPNKNTNINQEELRSIRFQF